MFRPFKENNILPKKYQSRSLPTLSCDYYQDAFRTAAKYAFVILDGYVWKIKLEEEMDFSLKDSDNAVEDWYFDNDCKINKKTYDIYQCLSIHLFNPYVDTIRVLFQEVVSDYNKCEKEKLELAQNSIKWEIELCISNHNKYYGIKLQVFKKTNVNNEWDLICATTTTTEHYKFNNITLYLRDSEKRIDILQHHKVVIFSKPTLPLPKFEEGLSVSIAKANKEYLLKIINCDDKKILLKCIIKLYSFIIKEPRKNKDIVEKIANLIFDIYKRCIEYDDKEFLLKYGVKLLSFAIVEHNADIYKTWNGEALINFKWNIYGKYYYIMIWIGFIALLGCFTAAATIPQEYIDDHTQKQLLIALIILGFIHLSFEVHQMIYDFNKWIHDFWKIFEFESFGIYFAIIISVGKQIISFFVVLLIIIISFAHAFYISLLPRSNFSFEKRTINNDPNNPWNIVPSYNQVFENRTIDPNPFIIQPPNRNTNMFVDFRTALFAMYKFLTGDSSALSNWTYTDNPSLAILIVLFSLLIVVYLMNLFIGLLNIAIDKDNDRVSYLILKAQVDIILSLCCLITVILKIH
ncbi:hypothetical protein RclHR1_15180002 [Rhizophagus clarus]|uniref:Ion transport domain-containing protein n=1 Tax=Rhizophagus clarus TaxID=94130 RepID=A0A2Z6QRY5_9GLOM|nr:hypothetical protein RclHR1_15180002 [Rhizophagus clarus]